MAGVPILINIPAFLIVALITWLLYIGVKESVRANNIMDAASIGDVLGLSADNVSQKVHRTKKLLRSRR